jgi:hypothetical protein
MPAFGYLLRGVLLRRPWRITPGLPNFSLCFLKPFKFISMELLKVVHYPLFEIPNSPSIFHDNHLYINAIISSI